MQSESKTDKPEFIHLDALAGISDEVTLGTACNFALHLTKVDIRFQCQTSTDYQDWMQALEIAYGLLHANTQGYNSNPVEPQKIGRENSRLIHPRSQMSIQDDSEDLMKRAYAIRQSIEHAPLAQSGSYVKYPSVNSMESVNNSVHQRPIPPRKDVAE